MTDIDVTALRAAAEGCQVAGCHKPAASRLSVCSMHWKRMHRHGSYDAIGNGQSLDARQRFWAKVEKTSGCWLWTAWLDENGYGGFSPTPKSQTRAHRYSWELHRAPIPSGMVVDHICRVRACVNPEHMEIVTPAENTLRGLSPTALNKRKTHCIRGHELAGKNLMLRKDGSRNCRACHDLRQAERSRLRAERRAMKTKEQP